MTTTELPATDPLATQTEIRFPVHMMYPDTQASESMRGKWWSTSQTGPIDGFKTFAEAQALAATLEARGGRALITTLVTVSTLVYVTPESA